jgi:hypothetical protein
MKMKWNWGTKLLVAMILFMGLIITMVFMSMRQTYYLVEKDYYPKALEYQTRIDKMHNVSLMDEKVKVENLGEQVSFTFPAALDPEGITGSIIFYRPSDGTLDLRFPIRPDTARRQFCDVAAVPKGKYIVKVDYESQGKGYYQEETIFLKMY